MTEILSSTDENQSILVTNETNHNKKNQIPVIDMSIDEDEFVLATELITAFRTIGFATLINHGVCHELIQQTYTSSQLFFTSLSLQEKRQYKYISHESNRGYIEYGQEKHHHSNNNNNEQQQQISEKTAQVLFEQPDRKETFDIGKEEHDDDEKGCCFQTPWPTNELSNDQFKDIMLQYFHQMNIVHLRIMKLIGIGLQLSDPNFFVHQCNNQHCNLRLLHYPEINKKDIMDNSNNNLASSSLSSFSPEDSTTITNHTTNKNQHPTNNDSNNLIIHRGAEHRDYGTITLLTQDNTGGLRVKCLDGTYTFVDPTPGSIIVNVGEMLQRWTNDLLIATPHQVIDHPNHASSNIIPERYSIAFFCNADKDVVIDPLLLSLSNTDDDEDAKQEQQGRQHIKSTKKYEPINAMEYLTQRLGATITK